jgi:hypothetical protein
MVLGRNGLRDERRRRVLIDETLHATASDASDAGNTDANVRAQAKTYAEAARVANHAPISVCIPKRPLSLWGLFLAGACVIAAIESLYAVVYLPAAPSLQSSLTALDVTARGSLASWFAAVVLCCAAMASTLVYLIRRHRTDDYRGRYRWWLWLAPLLLILSVNAGTGLHQVLSGLLTAFSGAEVAVGGKGWWLLAYAAVFFPIVLQLMFELWPSRLASMFFATAVTAYVWVAAFELNAVHCATPLATTLCHSSLLLAAHFATLLTVLAFGRYVYLEAHDSLAERRKWRLRMPRLPRLPKRKKKKKTPTDAPSEKEPAAESKREPKRLRVDNSHSKFGQENGQAPQVTLSTARATDDDDEDDRKLSKSERKRLRREGQRPV